MPLNTFPYKHTPAESLNRPYIHIHACLALSVIEGTVSEVPTGTLVRRGSTKGEEQNRDETNFSYL